MHIVFIIIANGGTNSSLGVEHHGIITIGLIFVVRLQCQPVCLSSRVAHLGLAPSDWLALASSKIVLLLLNLLSGLCLILRQIVALFEHLSKHGIDDGGLHLYDGLALSVCLDLIRDNVWSLRSSALLAC